MQHLPALSCGERRFCLPLCDASALVLAETLLGGEAAGPETLLGGEAAGPETLLGGEAAGALGAALQSDPALALWAVCRAAQRGEGELRSLEELAEWFAPRALDLLAWPPDEGGGEAADAGGQRRAACAALAERGVLAAELARALAADEPEPRRRQEELAALVHGAQEWFSGGGPVPLRELLPAWLARAAVFTESGGQQPSEPGWHAARAARLAGGEKPAAALLQGGGRAVEVRAGRAARRRAGEARRRWLRETPGAARMLVRLAAKLGRLRELETRFDERLEAEKIEALAEFAAGAGHEINNPLAVISGRVQLLLRDEPHPQRRRELASLHGQALRVHEMIADLMLFARPPRPQLEEVDAAAVLATVSAELGAQAAERGIALVNRLPAGGLKLRADPVQLAVAVRAIVQNALEAIGRDGRVEMVLAPAVLAGPPPAEAVEITVRDDGPGFTPQARRHAFDPFYSGRSAGRGLGNGLAKCWRIARLHGGQMSIASSPGAGAALTLLLPKAGPPGAAGA